MVEGDGTANMKGFSLKTPKIMEVFIKKINKRRIINLSLSCRSLKKGESVLHASSMLRASSRAVCLNRMTSRQQATTNHFKMLGQGVMHIAW